MAKTIDEIRAEFDRIVKNLMRDGHNRRDASRLAIIWNRPHFDALRDSGEFYPHQDVILTLPAHVVGDLAIPAELADNVASRQSAIAAYESAARAIELDRKVNPLPASRILDREQPELRAAYDAACN